MKEKIKKYLNKNNSEYIFVKIIIGLIISILLSFVGEKVVFEKMYDYFSFDRIFIFTGILFFIFLHFIFEVKKIYDIIYNKRYIIAIISFVLIVILGYSSSSITNYDVYIQGNDTKASFKPILGKQRPIRSDEWAVNTPLIFSQQNSQGEKYPYFNLNIRGTSTDMFAIINAPVADVVSIGKPFNIGYMLFGNKSGLSFWWFGRLITLLLVSFELSMIITKKKKLISLLGSLLITFAPATQWFYSNFIADILIFGSLALVLIDKYMTTDKKWVRYLSIIGVGFSAISYIFIFYPAWMISFGYIFFALFVWIVLKNKNNFKFDKKDLIVIFLTMLAVILILLRFYVISNGTLSAVMHTDYPGERFETGGGGEKTIFSYVYEMFFPYKSPENPCEFASMLSLFPFPIIISIIILIRNKEKRKELYKFLIPLLIVSLLLTIWVLFKVPRIFASLSMLYMVTTARAAVALSFSQVILIIYLLGVLKENDKLINNKYIKIILSVISGIILTYIAIKTSPDGYLGKKMLLIAYLITSTSIYLLLNINKEKYKKHFISLFILLALISGITINPIIKGVSVIYEKSISKEVQKISSIDPKALWLVDSMNFTIPNYIIANGARVINSTNYYPNNELYTTLFGKEKANNFKSIYNRYAHISVEIVNQKSDLKLLYPDATKLCINKDKLKDINVKYIVTSRDLKEFNSDYIKFDELYNVEGFIIYKVNY